MRKTADAPAYGFVVIGRNEGDRLIRCVEKLRPFGAPIVYADSGSSDGSPDTAERLGATVVRLRPDRPMNASRGRHEGFRRLRTLLPGGNYVQFVDGDCILDANWMEKAVSFMARNPEVAIVCGRRFEADPGASFYNRLCDQEWNTPVGFALASGGDALMRVCALEEVDGFDPTLMASEEPELAARLRARGWKVYRMDALMTEHDARIFSFSSYWRRSLRAGYGYVQAWRRTAGLPERINQRLLLSALTWVVLLPLFMIGLALLSRESYVLLLIPSAYAAQVIRIAVARGASDIFNWKVALVLLACKTAEFIGAVRGVLSAGRHSAFDYKEG